MVGGGTGAAMTAVTMIFEMTRDYDIIMPIIVAVALSIGVRRLLSRENIYTVKLVTRGHLIPKAMHANMFLVRHAEEVMDRDVMLLPAETDFAAFLRETSAGGFKHIVVTRDDRIVGVLRVNTELGSAWKPPIPASCSATSRRRISPSRAPRTSCSTWSSACGGAAPPWPSSPRAAAAAARQERRRHDFEGTHRGFGRRQHPALRQRRERAGVTAPRSRSCARRSKSKWPPPQRGRPFFTRDRGVSAPGASRARPRRPPD